MDELFYLIGLAVVIYGAFWLVYRIFFGVSFFTAPKDWRDKSDR